MDLTRLKSVEVLDNTSVATKKDNPFLIKLSYTDNTVITTPYNKKQAKNKIKEYKAACKDREDVKFDTDKLK